MAGVVSTAVCLVWRRRCGGGVFVFGQEGRGPGAGVVVGAVAPVFRLRLLALRCGVDLGLVVDPCGAQPRGWRVVLCCIGFFGQFPS